MLRRLNLFTCHAASLFTATAIRCNSAKPSAANDDLIDLVANENTANKKPPTSISSSSVPKPPLASAASSAAARLPGSKQRLPPPPPPPSRPGLRPVVVKSSSSPSATTTKPAATAPIATNTTKPSSTATATAAVANNSAATLTPQELHSLVEFVKLLIPHGGQHDTGMLMTEIFAALAPEQRTAIRRHSKMLSKFLLNFPDHFAVSPGGSIVIAVDNDDDGDFFFLFQREGQGEPQQQRNSSVKTSSSSTTAAVDQLQREKKLAEARAIAQHRAAVAEALLRPAGVESFTPMVPVSSSSSSTTTTATATTTVVSAAIPPTRKLPVVVSVDDVLLQQHEEHKQQQEEAISDETLALLASNINADCLEFQNRPITAMQEMIEEERRIKNALLAHAEANAVGDLSSSSSSSSSSASSSSYTGPCHYNWEHIKLPSIPPPDLVKINIDLKGRAPLEKRQIEGMFESALSTQTLVKFIPRWFVPCAEVIRHMHGYTEEHFEQFFGDSAAVEVINLNGHRFVRIHGGLKHKALVDFDVPEAMQAEELFASFKPDPKLALDILPVMPPRGQWATLFDVVTRLPPAVQQRLPFQGPLSLLYFAQMQHIFSFTPNNGGGISVPLGLPSHLHWDSTPFVKQFHRVFNALMGRPTFVGDLMDVAMPPGDDAFSQLREEMLRGLMLARAVHGPGSGAAPQLAAGNFPPQFAFEADLAKDLDAAKIEDLLRVFVSLHKTVLAYQGENTFVNGSSTNSGGDDNSSMSASELSQLRTVMLRFEFEAEERHQLDIHEQIEIAKRRGNNKQLRKLKRRLAAMNQPDNPLLEEEALAKALAEFLPPDRSISWPRLKKNLPMEILELLPPQLKKFFDKYPQHFKRYDVGVLTNHTLHLQVPHLPPPPGSFRKAGDYSDEELVSAVGQILLRGPKTIAALSTFIPGAIADTLRERFGGVAQLVQAHPQNFALVIKDVKNKDLRTAVVTLLSVPNLVPLEHDVVEAEKAANANREELSRLSSQTGFENDDGDGDGEGGGGGADVWGAVIEQEVGVSTRRGSGGSSPASRGGGDRDDIWTKAAVGGDDNNSDAASPEPKSSSLRDSADAADPWTSSE